MIDDAESGRADIAHQRDTILAGPDTDWIDPRIPARRDAISVTTDMNTIGRRHWLSKRWQRRLNGSWRGPSRRWCQCGGDDVASVPIGSGRGRATART